MYTIFFFFFFLFFFSLYTTPSNLPYSEHGHPPSWTCAHRKPPKIKTYIFKNSSKIYKTEKKNSNCRKIRVNQPIDDDPSCRKITIWKGDLVLNIWIYQGKGFDGVPGIGIGFQMRDFSHDVSKASDEPSPSSVDFRPACGLAWAGCQSIPRAGVDWLSLSLFFSLGAGLFCFQWICSHRMLVLIHF